MQESFEEIQRRSHADLALTPDVREDHASYIASWLQVLKYKRAVFTAASHAQTAAVYLGGLQKPEQEAAAA